MVTSVHFGAAPKPLENMFLLLSFALAPLVHSSVMPEVKNTLALALPGQPQRREVGDGLVERQLRTSRHRLS